MAGLGGFVTGVKTKLAVDGATSTSDDPTPIYVLDELVASLSAGDTRAGVDAVCARLAHRSPVVKQKALKLVTHIGRKGSSDLRRLMARQSGAVRDLLHYRCEPDPFKGDTVWKRVQEYAQEALEAVHGNPDAAVPAQSTLGGRIQGFGSDAAGAGHASGGSSGMMGFGSESAGGYGGSRGGGGSRMVGFGSADIIQSGMQAISSSVRGFGGSQDGYSFTQLGGGGNSSYSSSSMSSRPGASAGSFSQPIVQTSAPDSNAAAAGVAAAPASASAAGGAEHAAEQRLVERICTPAGLRAAPGSEDLRTFVEGLAPLEGPVVAQLLERKLEGAPWQATLRALCAIEAVLESGCSTSCGQVAVHFQTQPDAVRRAANSPHASVRQRAQKLLGMLGDAPSTAAAASAGPASSSTSTTGTAAAGQQQQQQLFTEDLLGDAEPASTSTGGAELAGLLGEPAPTSAATLASAPAAPRTTVDLLAGLDSVPGGPAASPLQQRPADLFGDMRLGQPQRPPLAAAPLPATAAVQPPSDLDLLAGLSVGAGIAGPAPAAASLQSSLQSMPVALPQQKQQEGSSGLEDLLGSLSVGAAMPAAGPPLSSTSGGGGLSLGGPTEPLGLPMGAPVPPGGTLGPGLTSGGPRPMPYQQQHHQHYQQQPQVSSLGTWGTGSSGTQQHGRSPYRNGAPSGGTSTLGNMGILDSAKDNSFNFVDDAIAAARRKQ